MSSYVILTVQALMTGDIAVVLKTGFFLKPLFLCVSQGAVKKLDTDMLITAC